MSPGRLSFGALIPLIRSFEAGSRSIDDAPIAVILQWVQYGCH